MQSTKKRVSEEVNQVAGEWNIDIKVVRAPTWSKFLERILSTKNIGPMVPKLVGYGAKYLYRVNKQSVRRGPFVFQVI
jgi:hypothetical protein